MSPKQTYWFKHDSDALDDPKMIVLMEELGMEGHGIYWMLVCLLRQQANYRLSMVVVPGLARRYSTTVEKIKAVIERYGLFVVEAGEFYSERLSRDMAKLDGLREVGRQSVLKRWHPEQIEVGNSPLIGTYKEPNTNLVDTYEVPTTNRTEQNRTDKRGVLRSYGTHSNVKLSEGEYQRLILDYGEGEVTRQIENLSWHIATKGTKYLNHNLTLRNWFRRDKVAPTTAEQREVKAVWRYR